jgi:hypothetical protein
MVDEPLNTAPDAGEERATVTIRRAPKFSVFVVVGALTGFLVTLVLTSLFPADPAVGFAASLGYFSLFGVPIGAVLAAVIALIADRRASRHSTEVIASKLTVHGETETSPVDESVPGSVPDSDG